MMIPTFYVGRFIEVDRFIEAETFYEIYEFIHMARAYANVVAVSTLILITGFVTYALGSIKAKLDHLDGDESGDSHLHRATPH